jgi:hypothetical protein
MGQAQVKPVEAPALPVCEVAFRGVPYQLPEGVIESGFCRHADGGYQLSYTVLEKDAGSVLMDRKRKLKYTVYFDSAGNENARCLVTHEWESDVPSIGDVLAHAGR